MDYWTLNYNCHYLQNNQNKASQDKPPSERIFLGTHQQERMIADKRKTLDRATLYSYQAAIVNKIYPQEGEEWRALMNPNLLKQDYDDKIISIRCSSGFQPGDVFYWKNGDSNWLIYLQDLTELAYFRGEVRRCRYRIYWRDADGNEYMTYAAVRGPVETKINYIQKKNISVDIPNYSLNMLIPKSEAALQYFVRYGKFYLEDSDYPDRKICWRIEATDTVSMPGIIQLNAVEYYSNEHEDDIARGVVDAKIPTRQEEIDELGNDGIIKGEAIIKPKKEYTYIYTGNDDADWIYDNKLPITIVEKVGTRLTLKWEAMYNGEIKLQYGEHTMTIKVESLF